ncbi:MAG: xanthine dehydrogenase family protein subunit M [Acidobacteria bacterium]|nr:MAG: xanthine dehydrogenase family protein subunit M [Acidobacteriota bacterium]
MYPPPFDYQAPDSLEEALAILAEHGYEAKALAGGQSLIPLLKLRFAAPAVLVDLGRIPGLDGVEAADGELRIGALARHNQLAASPLVAERCPAASAAAPQIADPLVRNLGTLGGSLAHADPAGDWGSVMIACGAQLVLASAGGRRTVPATEFFRGVFDTALEPTELLTEVRIPSPRGPAGGTYLKLERKVGDFATVGVAVSLELDGAGRIARAGIGLTAVGPQNLRAAAAEEALAGAEPTAEAFAEAGRLAAGGCEPASDVRGSAEYKRHVVEVYVRRGLARALEIARRS